MPATPPAPEPPASQPLWRRIPLGLVVIGIVGAVSVGTALFFNASRGDDGSIDRAGDLTAGDLRAGDCFDLKDPDSEEVGDVTAKPCTELHQYEAFFAGNLPEGDYPADDAVGAFVVNQCGPAFETFVGRAYEESRLELFYLIPTQSGWRTGDRSVLCALYEPGPTADDVTPVTQSLKSADI
jgi:hypothetical protein